jgi:hypothetical protein
LTNTVQYRPQIATKRPSTVEAWFWDGGDETADLIVDWIESNKGFAARHPHEPFIILGKDIDVLRPKHWVIRDQFNEFWPLDDTTFRAVYKSSF